MYENLATILVEIFWTCCLFLFVTTGLYRSKGLLQDFGVPNIVHSFWNESHSNWELPGSVEQPASRYLQWWIVLKWAWLMCSISFLTHRTCAKTFVADGRSMIIIQMLYLMSNSQKSKSGCEKCCDFEFHVMCSLSLAVTFSLCISYHPHRIHGVCKLFVGSVQLSKLCCLDFQSLLNVTVVWLTSKPLKPWSLENDLFQMLCFD